MVKVPCGNCGNEFKPHHQGEAFCIPCEFAIRAVEPPQHLKDMRWVYEGRDALTPAQKQMLDLMTQDKGKFLDRLNRFDDQYRATVAKKMPGKVVQEAPVWDGKGKCPTCMRGSMVEAGVEECIGRTEQWLKSRAEAQEKKDGL